MRKQVDLERFKRRYRVSNRKSKSKLLTELGDLYGYNRKYLLQFFNGISKKKNVRRGPKLKYEPREDLLVPLRRIWLASDQMCSKRLKEALPSWLGFYEASYEILSAEVMDKLLSMSTGTLDRLLAPYRAKYKRRGLCGTKPGYLLKNHIPIKTDHWDVTKPGFMEADTVAHCGDSMAGNFVWSLTMTDIMTSWTENRATWNKGSAGVEEQIKNIEKKLPFLILGLDFDNGSEFLAWHLIRYFEAKKVQLSRSRPYRKNDNAHVEQKNWTHVRHLFGYDRFAQPRLVPLMNDLYENEWSKYQNHFMPNQKLIKKEKINSRYKKHYERAKTPYQRIQESAHIDRETKLKLAGIHQALNPFELKKTIEKKLRRIYQYVTLNKKPRSKI